MKLYEIRSRPSLASPDVFRNLHCELRRIYLDACSFALLHRLGCPCPRIARHNDVTEADEAQANKPSQFDLPALGFPSLHSLGRSPSSMSYHPVSTAQQKTHPSAPLSLLALPEHAWLGQDFGTLVSSSVLRTDAKKSTECLWPFNLLDSNP